MKTALIIGSSTGIGAEIAREFAKNGYYVVITYNTSKTSAERLQGDLEHSMVIQMDVRDYTSVKNAISKVITARKTIEVAVINAGISKVSLLMDSTIEDINNVINTNLTGPIYCLKELSKYMCNEQFGKIITIASMWGEVGASCESVYAATKGGLIALTKSMAKELGYNNINVNCISPGLIDTPMNAHLSNEDISNIINNTPTSRIGTPADIAKAAIWLASDSASYINGQVISINGGFVI